MLLFSYIIFGSYALIVQVVCIREILVVFHGNELCLGIVFACWLVGVAVGAGISSRIIDRIRFKLPFYLLCFLILSVLFPVQIYTIRILRHLLQVAPGEFISLGKLVVGSLCTITPFSFFVGAIFPVACSLFPRSESQSIGRLYIAEAVGSIIGGVAFTFVLVARCNAFQIAALSGGLMLVMAAIISFYSNKESPKFSLLCGISVFALVLGICFGVVFFSQLSDSLHILTVKKRWQSMQYHIDFVKSVDSKYENLTIGTQAGQYTLFTNGQYASVFPDEYGAAITAHFFMTQHPAPHHVLLIGGGAEGLIEEILKHPVTNLDYVELDPKLLSLLSEYLSPAAKQALNDPRVDVLYADGRYYVKQTHRRYDIIILNVPDPTTAMLNRFYTLEFFRELLHILNPGGVIVAEISSSLHLQEDAANYTGSLYTTLRHVFPYVLVTPGTDNIYFATTRPHVISLNPEILRERYLQRKIDSDYFSEYHYETLLQPEQITFIESTLQQGEHAFRLNTDFQPVTYFYSLLLWMKFSKETPERHSVSILLKIFHTLRHLPAWYFFLPIICVVIERIVYLGIVEKLFAGRRAHQRNYTAKFNCLWAIGTTGFAGMALELILILAFQNMYGYVYQKAGLIVAAFMVGLAIGGYVSHNSIAPDKQCSSGKLLSRLLSVEIIIVLFAVLLPCCLRALSELPSPTVVEIIFMSLVSVTGFLVGMEFPLVGAMYLYYQKKVGKTAGMLDSSDHIGACCGSLFIGVILVPLSGIAISCYVISALNLSSVFFLGLERLKYSS